jgi:glutathione S-transferase
MSELLLVIGNRNYSSWSLRAWLALKNAGLDFDEEMTPLDLDNTKARLLSHSPAGRVPVLCVNKGNAAQELTIWDSMAIIEYLAEQRPGPNWWPGDVGARAAARAVCAEMHAGFDNLRREMPMNVRAAGHRIRPSDACQSEIARIGEIWRDCRHRFGQDGAFLFGGVSAADAMFAPIVSRFKTYGVSLDAVAADYAEAVWSSENMQWWRAASADEPWTIPREEVGQL